MKKSLHFRRCHICSHLNEGTTPIVRCSSCSKSLAPFFYFDERVVRPSSDVQLRPQPLQGEYSPIQGLTAYWEGF